MQASRTRLRATSSPQNRCPDYRVRLLRTIFWNAVGRIRSKFRALTGDPAFDPFERDGDIFRVNPSIITADLWDLRQALARVRTAEDIATRRAALQEAARCYGGELLHDMPFDWAEELREQLRLDAITAIVDLADLAESDGDLDTARRALENALDIGVLVEEVYRRLMRLLLNAGRHDDVHSVYRRLVAALRTIEGEPDDATEALLEIAIRASAASA